MVTLTMKRPDFTTNDRIVVAINKRLRGFYAKSLDKASVQVKIPVKYQNEQVKFISLLERVSVFVDTEAVVVVNQRTGTVVLGGL